MKTAVFEEKEDNVVLQLELEIPKKSGKPVLDDLASFNMLNIIGAFSARIICSLERRMQACQRNLLNHLEDIESNDGTHICWYRKDGSVGSFNIYSFNAMKECLEALEHSRFEEFAAERVWISQTLKALLNDTVQDHSDSCGFRYSQLVSILCELQACPMNFDQKL